MEQDIAAPPIEETPEALAVIAAAKPLITRRKGGRARAMHAGVLSGSKFFSASELADVGMTVQKNEKGESEIIAKSFGDAENIPATRSQEIGEDEDPYDYNTDGVVEPPWPFTVLQELFTSNTIHGAAIETKASDATYSALAITATGWAKENVAEDVLARAREEVERFIKVGASGRPVEDLLRDVAMDYESLGSAGFEVRRDLRGFVAAINHIPFGTMRVLKDTTAEKTHARFMHHRFNKKSLFIDFGNAAIATDKNNQPFDPAQAPPEDFPPYDSRTSHFKRADYVDAKKGKPTANRANAANEFVMLARPPHTKSTIYGTPAGITAYKAMLAQIKIDDYNIQFFANKGVPQYAVIFEGLGASAGDEGLVADPDATGDEISMEAAEIAALEETLRLFFQKQLAKGDRSVLVLTLVGDAKVRFERLSTDKLEASFAEYEKRNQENIRISHRMPGAAMGLLDTANLGSGRDDTMMRRYRDHIVAPMQRMFAKYIDMIVRVGLLIPYFEFAYIPLDIEEEQAARAFALKEFEAGAITLDQYLEATGRTALPDGRGDVRIFRVANTTMFPSDPEDVQMRIQESIQQEKSFRAQLLGTGGLQELEEQDKALLT